MPKYFKFKTKKLELIQKIPQKKQKQKQLD